MAGDAGAVADKPTSSSSGSASPDEQVMDERLAGSMGFMVSVMRAVESARDDRIANDPFADALSRKARSFFLPLLSSWAKGTYNPINFMAFRTRFHDDALDARHPDAHQVVMLGSGLDARAYYLESLRGCHVLEIDESAGMFKHKKQVLQELDAKPVADKVDYIVANLLEPGWEKKLLEHGFDPSIPTFWSMEGLLMYLDRASNVKLLQTIDGLSAPGSGFFADMLGEVLVKQAENKLLEDVENMKKKESRGGILRHGEDDPMHGVLSEIGWDLELQLSLTEGGTHLGREWVPSKSDATGSPVPMNFIVGKKPLV